MKKIVNNKSKNQMGGCVCSNNFSRYFKGYSDFVLKSETNKNVNGNKMPEQNIKIIPREDIFKIDKIENNNEISKKNNYNITKNNNSNFHDENHISIDNNSNNNNLYLQNTKHKEIKNNKDSNNNNFSFNKQINNNKNDNNNNNLNNNNNDINNNREMNNMLQQKLQGKDALKKSETNYNYNLGDHNVIFINISRDSSFVKNGSEKKESATPKMAVGKENLDEMVKGTKKIFSHFCKHKIPEKSPKNQTTTNNHLIKHKTSINDYMDNYSDEMLNVLNSIRKDPDSFIKFIDDLIKNSKKTNDGVFISSQNVDDEYLLMEEHYIVFEQIKNSLRDIIKSNLPSIMEDFKYNDELEIMLDDTKGYSMNQSHIEKTSSFSNHNDKYNSGNNNNNHIIKRPKKHYKILDLSDDKIANLILKKRKEIKNKYPNNIFKMNIIKDIKINILIQISMEEYYNQCNAKNLLKGIIFNPQYKNFAVSWANELNRKFISISCFA